MHTRDDYSCERGYELWLLAEAKARNPAIVTYGLMWAAPGWINNGTFYGPDMIAYALAWLDCVTNRTGGSKLDYLGLWNEAAQPDVDYLVQVGGGWGGDSERWARPVSTLLPLCSCAMRWMPRGTPARASSSWVRRAPLEAGEVESYALPHGRRQR